MTSPAPSASPSHGASDVTVSGFLWPEPELVQQIRDGLEAHKRSEQERNAHWIAHCLKELRRPDANGD